MILASVDLTPFTSLITLILGGGFAYAYAVWRKTPVEVESISVTILRRTIETLGDEVERLNTENADLRHRIELLEQRS